jgi:hypothetical protein
MVCWRRAVNDGAFMLRAILPGPQSAKIREQHRCGRSNQMKPDATKSRGHGDKKPGLRERFIMALLANPSVETAAESVGIHRVTAWRWMKDPAVVQRLTETRRQCMGHAMMRLQAAASASVTTLVEVQASGESESARVSAARTVLEMALRAAEIGELEERLTRLEQIARNNNWRLDDHQPDHPQAGTARTTNGAA